MGQNLHSDSACDLTARFHQQELDSGNLVNILATFDAQENDHPIQNNLHIQPSNAEHGMTLEGKSIYSSAVKQHLLDGSTDGLKKHDSFGRWMSKELGDVNEPRMQCGPGASWDAVESENGVDGSNNPSQSHLDTYILGPSLSQDQLFSIVDFSPNWAYVGSEIKVL